MINIKYETWKKSCEFVREYAKKYGKFYIQLYPLNCSLERFATSEFYDSYIKNGLIFMDYANFDRIDNYCNKDNGSYRNRYLITPIMYLYYVAIGLHISENYRSNRTDGIVVNYGGNFEDGDLHYRDSYNNFVKKVLSELDDYNYFFKMDVADFYNKLDINKLSSKISNAMRFKQNEQMFFKEFLLFCGNGYFPQIECGITSSYLATEIYFENIDNQLFKFLQKKSDVKKFKIFRYVDDLYILLDIDGRKNTDKIENSIESFYQDELYKYNLSINKQKSKFDKTTNIYACLKSFSVFDDPYDDVEIPIEYKKHLMDFLSELCSISDNKSITYKKYSDLLKKYFDSDDNTYHTNQLLYVLIYKNISWLNSGRIIKKLVHIIQNDFNILTVDPRKMVAMITNTYDGELIRAFLNKLYIAAEMCEWNVAHKYIAREYLLRRNFVSTKLLNKMEQYNEADVRFLKRYYKNDWRKMFNNNYLLSFAGKVDLRRSPVVALKFLEITSMLNEDYLMAQSYNKNYFDAMTNHFDMILEPEHCKKKVFYSKRELKRIYTQLLDIDYSEWEKIDRLCDTRNGNPLCHASMNIFNSKNDINKKIKSDIEFINNFINSIIINKLKNM